MEEDKDTFENPLTWEMTQLCLGRSCSKFYEILGFLSRQMWRSLTLKISDNIADADQVGRECIKKNEKNEIKTEVQEGENESMDTVDSCALCTVPG